MNTSEDAAALVRRSNKAGLYFVVGKVFEKCTKSAWPVKLIFSEACTNSGRTIRSPKGKRGKRFTRATMQKGAASVCAATPLLGGGKNKADRLMAAVMVVVQHHQQG